MGSGIAVAINDPNRNVAQIEGKVRWVHDVKQYIRNPGLVGFVKAYNGNFPIVGDYPLAIGDLLQLHAILRCFRSILGLHGLIPNHRSCTKPDKYQEYAHPEGGIVKPIFLNVNSGDCVDRYLWVGAACIGCCWMILFSVVPGMYCLLNGRWRLLGGILIGIGGLFAAAVSVLAYWAISQQNKCIDEQHTDQQMLHGGTIVPQKYLDTYQLLGYTNSSEASMANVLNTDKQIAIIGALTEGSSIRSIERMTGVHRDTIMRLGVRVGERCARLMDGKMRDLPCTRLEMDEIWGFVGKKERNVRIDEPAPVGNVWTFCAIDADTKLVPAFKVGDRGIATARAFVQDVASRMRARVQISTDGLRAYVEAIEGAFGSEVDYAQIVKTYGHEEVSDNRRYSAPEFVSCEKKVITGNPDERLISTSYVERLNATTRLHMRRLTRLTLAFSKKRENFEAAVALHFAYYNFVKRHNTLRCTPAMAAGVEQGFWTVGDLLEATA